MFCPESGKYNSSNGMYISQTFSWDNTPGPLLQMYFIDDRNKRLIDNLNKVILLLKILFFISS